MNPDNSSQSSLTKITKRIGSFTSKKLKLASFGFITPATKKRREIQARILQNENDKLMINRLPVEIFIRIVLFTGRPWVMTPYPFIVFSWVCHYWRSIILSDVVFWKTIVILRHGISRVFLKQLLSRSQDAPLEIIAQCSKLLKVCTRDLRLSPTVAIRVKTFDLIHVQCVRHNYSDRCPKLSSALLSFFPSLEHVFCSGAIDSIPLSIQPQLKTMQASIYLLGNFAIPGFFRELRWLFLTYQADVISLRSLLEALQNLPKLQSLHLIGSLQPFLGAEVEGLGPITFNELTILISNCPLLHLINAPKLSYLRVEVNTAVYPEYSFTKDTYGHLCGFDFSRITRIRSGITRRSMDFIFDYHITGSSTYEWQHVDDFCLLWQKYGHDSSFNLGESYQFGFSFSVHGQLIPTFVLCLEKSINLVEIVLTWFSLDSLEYTEVTSFLNALRSTTTVRDLTILSGGSLKDFCNLLSDGEILPGLERLNYSASDHEKDTYHSGYISKCLLKLVKKRLKTSLTPLKIQLCNFPLIQPRELEQMEILGLGVIQKEDQLEIMAYPKKMEGCGEREKKKKRRS